LGRLLGVVGLGAAILWGVGCDKKTPIYTGFYNGRILQVNIISPRFLHRPDYKVQVVLYHLPTDSKLVFYDHGSGRLGDELGDLVEVWEHGNLVTRLRVPGYFEHASPYPVVKGVTEEAPREIWRFYNSDYQAIRELVIQELKQNPFK